MNGLGFYILEVIWFSICLSNKNLKNIVSKQDSLYNYPPLISIYQGNQIT